MRKVIFYSTFAFFFTGCAQNIPTRNEAVADIKKGPDAIKPRSAFASPHTNGVVRDDWLKTFRDPKLNKLVREGEAHNPNLKVAAYRVERAAALTRLTESELKPTINMAGFYHDNNNAGANEVSFGGLGTSWEPDVWGRVGNLVSADQALTRSQIADYEFARQSLAAQIATVWFQLNANSKIYEFNREIVKIQEKGLFVLNKREEIGQGNKRDVHLSKALVASAEDSARASLAAKERSQRALEVLIGRYPSARITAKFFYRALPKIPSGLPAQILERRPDLIAAEERVAAAFHQKTSAKLLHLPNVRLKLGLGPNSINDAITSLTAGIFAPLYTGGAIEAQVDTATAEQKAAIASYAWTALRAFQEVEDRLAAEKHMAVRYTYISTMVKEYKTAYDMTIEKYRIGESTVLDILVIQGKWIKAEIAKLQIAKERLINRVNLHLALGGSFDTRHANYKLKQKQ
ncbi:Outer membrane component of tripartite multidrug resistance system [hydrothermal vent metagenome]|uniref:Outer membrane component of tripartite multidrug resistance system n=1 Tax=hydrothermal vent metagenome TaxID=652676 RepID=A0A1W1BKA1_9ZZZZ